MGKKFLTFDKKKIYTFIITTIITIIVGFYGYYSVSYWNKSIIWRDIEISELKLKDSGPKYRVSNGIIYKNDEKRKIKFEINPIRLVENDRVLRLALFYQMNIEDPLFSGSGVDVNSFDTSTTKLAKVQGELLKVAGYKENFLPIDFLKNVGNVVKTTKELETDKSLGKAKGLIANLRRANNAYQSDVENLISKIETFNPLKKSLIQIASVTTEDIIYKDLKKIKNNHNNITREIQKRENCLNLNIIFCKRKIEKINMDGLMAFTNNKETLTPRILGLNEIYFLKSPSTMDIEGPYQINSNCLRGEQSAKDKNYLYAFVDKENNTKLIPKLATNNYYLKTKTSNIDKQYRQDGLEWRVSFMTSPYACNNLEYYSSLATVNNYYKNMKAIFPGLIRSSEFNMLSLDEKKIVQKGAELENIFFTEKYPSQDSLEILGDYYKKVYYYLVNKQSNSLDNGLLVANKNEILDRSLLITNKLVDIDKSINFFTYILNGYTQNFAYDETDRESYVYEIRSGYSFLYLGFSPSVWRSKEHLSYVDTESSSIRDDQKSFDQMISEFGYEYTMKITKTMRAEIWKERLGHYIE